MEEDISVNEGSDGSRKRKKHENRREARKKQKYLDPDPRLEGFTRPCRHDGKTYECCKVGMESILKQRTQFYSHKEKVSQDMFLCKYMSVMPAKRRRQSKEMKERTATVCYMLKSDKNMVRVCKTFFSAVFGVTKHRLVTVAKVLEEGGVPKEKRGGDRVSKKSSPKKEKVRQFIGNLRGKESHYNRKKQHNLCFDLQQVQPLPRTPIGDAFYSHQISWYAFCCVPMTSRNPVFYVWTEDLAGRGAIQIGSALFHHLQSLNYEGVHLLRLFCDGCGGQNKNSHIIHTLMYWLKNKSPDNVTEIIITYPVRGQSFLPADRSFGRVEKILKRHPVITSKEKYMEMYSEVGSVKTLGPDWQMYDVKELHKVYKKIKGISECKKIHLKKFLNKNNKTTIKVKTFQFYRFAASDTTWESLLKKGKSEDNLQLNRLPLGNSIPEKKKKSLTHLMKEHFGEDWRTRKDLLWYKNLLDGSGGENIDILENKETQEDEEEPCDCLHEETAIHI